MSIQAENFHNKQVSNKRVGRLFVVAYITIEAVYFTVNA